MFQSLEYPKTRRALEVFAKLFTNYLKQEISKNQFPYAPGYKGGGKVSGIGNKVASGKLLNSISYEIDQDSEGNPRFVLSYVDYFEAVNSGRRPQKKKVPIQALLDWIKIRGLKGRNKKGQFIPNLSLAFAIQTNIYKFGIAPAGIYDKGLDGLLTLVENPPPNLADELQEIYDMIAEDVNMFIEKTITKIQ